MDANAEPATGHAKKQPYATQEDAERYLANWNLIRQLEAEQKDLGEKLKLAMLDGDEFNDGLLKLSLTQPTVVEFDKDKFIRRFGKDKYIKSSKLQVGLVKEHMAPSEYKRMLEEGEIATTSPGTPTLRVYPV